MCRLSVFVSALRESVSQPGGYSRYCAGALFAGHVARNFSLVFEFQKQQFVSLGGMMGASPEIEMLDADSLIPYANNTRTHSEDQVVQKYCDDRHNVYARCRVACPSTLAGTVSDRSR